MFAIQYFTKKSPVSLIFVCVLVFCAFFLSGCELDLKKVFNTDKNLATGNVKGLNDVPVFPNSEFLFTDSESSVEVKKMLSEHNSAYRLTNDASFEEVVDFYKETLKKKGWQFDHEAKIDSKTEKTGFYWTKENQGLRIYQQINDIWYESLSADEAKTGLAYLVALESKEYYNPENLVKLNTVTQTSWELDYPDSWDVEQKNSSYSSGLDTIFKYSLGGFELRIQDLGKEMGTSLEQVWHTYLDKLNEGKKEGEMYELLIEEELQQPTEDPTSIIEFTPGSETGQAAIKPNPATIKLTDLDGLELKLVKKDTGSKAYITFVKHPANARFYAITNIIGDKEFYDYIKMTIKPL